MHMRETVLTPNLHSREKESEGEIGGERGRAGEGELRGRKGQRLLYKTTLDVRD